MIIVQTGHFYFLSDEYYDLCKDDTLMRNKETVNDVPHGRPCFFAFTDESSGLMWLIPISSQVEKYKAIAKRKVEKYGRCDTILFYEVLGHEKAFLIQNMFPVIERFIEREYIDPRTSLPVRIARKHELEVIRRAKIVLEKHKLGIRIIFTDVDRIGRVMGEFE